MPDGGLCVVVERAYHEIDHETKAFIEEHDGDSMNRTVEPGIGSNAPTHHREEAFCSLAIDEAVPITPPISLHRDEATAATTHGHPLRAPT